MQVITPNLLRAAHELLLVVLPSLPDELVRLKVDLILAWFTPAALAAKQATREFSIVMAAAGDPTAKPALANAGRLGISAVRRGRRTDELLVC